MVTLDVNPFGSRDGQYDFELEESSLREVTASRAVCVAAPSVKAPQTFQCVECTYQTQIQELFNRHVVRHSRDRPFECTLCRCKISDHSEFVSHLVSHQRSEVIKCPFYTYASSAASMKLHMLKHRQVDLFECSECDFSSNNPKPIACHTEAFHCRLFKCEYCRERMTKYSLIKHWDEVHGIKEVSAEPIHLRSIDPPTLIPHCCQPIFCSEVKQECVQDHEDIDVARIQPLSVHSHEECETREFADIEIEQNDCSVCEFSTPLKVVLKFHILNMHTVKISCRHCPATMTQYALIQHYRNFHGIHIYFDGKGLQTTNRDTKTSVKHNNRLEIPAKVLISGDKFMCSVCKFSSTHALNVHRHIEKLHQRKYTCSDCRAVMSKHALIKHARIEHGVILHKKSSRSFVVAEHQDSDTDESNPCSDDDSGDELGPSAGQVRADKPFACTMCDFVSHNKFSLQCHTKFLHGVKYHCRSCPAIMTKHEIMQHSSSEHGIEIPLRGRSGLRKAGSDGCGAVGNLSGPEHSTLLKVSKEDSVRCIDNNNSNDTSSLHDKRKVCRLCDFTAMSDANVLVHVERMHTRKFHCGHCPVVMTKHDLTKHYLEKHGRTLRLKGLRLRKADDQSHESQVAVDGVAESSSLNAQNVKDEDVDYVDSWVKREYVCNDCPAVRIIEHAQQANGVSSPRALSSQSLRPAEGLTGGETVQGHDAHVQRQGRSRKSNPESDVPSSTSLKRLRPTNDCDLASDDDESEFFQAINTRTRSSMKLDDSSEFMRSVEGKENATWHCIICDTTLCRKVSFNKHVSNMHDKPFKCASCSAVMTKFELIQHNKNVHGIIILNNGRGNRSYYQEVDEETEQDDVAGDPAISADEGISEQRESVAIERVVGAFVCPDCSYSSPYKRPVQLHLHGMHRKKYGCYDCSVVASKHDLIRHYESVHDKKVKKKNATGRFFRDLCSVDDDENVSVSEGDDHGDADEAALDVTDGDVTRVGGVFKCNPCGHEFLLKGNADRHFRQVHSRKYSCYYCSAIMNKYEMVQHQMDHGVVIKSLRGRRHVHFTPVDGMPGCKKARHGELTDCSVQNEPSVSEMPDEDRTLPVVQEGSQFKCSICTYSSFFRQSLKLHFSSLHEKKYSCNRCSVVTTKYDMFCHYKDTHGLVIPNLGRGKSQYYKAVDIPETTADSVVAAAVVETVVDDLPAGVILGGEKSFVCTDNVNGSSLLDGRRILGGNSELIIPLERVYRCTYCDHVSVQKGNRESHIEVFHKKKYSCNRCSVVLSKYRMIQHYETDHNVKLGGNGIVSKYFVEVDSADRRATSIDHFRRAYDNAHNSSFQPVVSLERVPIDVDDSDTSYKVLTKNPDSPILDNP